MAILNITFAAVVWLGLYTFLRAGLVPECQARPEFRFTTFLMQGKGKKGVMLFKFTRLKAGRAFELLLYELRSPSKVRKRNVYYDRHRQVHNLEHCDRQRKSAVHISYGMIELLN